MDIREFGEMLAEARSRKDWSQDALGAELGVSQQSVQSYETGGSFPGKNKWDKIQELFGFDMEKINSELVRPPRRRSITQVAHNNNKVWQAGKQTFSLSPATQIPAKKQALIELIIEYAPDSLVDEITRKLLAVKEALR